MNPIDITIPPDINLVVTDITAPATVASGQTFSLSWTVQNQGTTTTSSSWTDTVFYSSDEIFGNEDDVYLGESSYNYYYYSGNLEANETYSKSLFITLPTQIPENGYLLLKTDQSDNQTETNETDNVKSVAINLTHPQDNLVVTEITVPESPKFGQKISLSWTVQNQGIETTTSSSWTDAVVYSTDEIFGNKDDIYLWENFNYNNNLDISPYPDHFTFVPPVNPNETYTITKNITLPTQGPENGYLLVKTDNGNSQPETDETDNVKAVAITLTQPKANLVVTEITSPTVALPGEPIPLAWTVQNQGIDQTTASYWTDRVVYSTDDIFGNEDDIHLTESYNYNYDLNGWVLYPNNDSYVPLLNPNETYTINRSFWWSFSSPLPSEIGNGYLLVKTDVNNNQVETDETDNVKAVPITLTKPNLVVTDITAPISAKNGQTVSVSWTVQNQGDIATDSSSLITTWTDSTVYSTDDIFGNEDDINLPKDSFGFNSSLAPNETYTTNLNITIPKDIAGRGYLFVKTDKDKSLREIDETDNTKAVPITIARTVSTDDTNNNAPTVTNPNTVTEDFILTTIGGSMTGTSGPNNMKFGTQTVNEVLFTAGGSLAGGEGDDTFSTLNPNLPVKGVQYAYGNQGNDNIRLSKSFVAYGGQGNDYIEEIGGSGEAQQFFGNQGNDTIKGGAGADYLHGGKGNDSIEGGTSPNSIVGDTIIGGQGSDILDGGTEFNTETNPITSNSQYDDLFRYENGPGVCVGTGNIDIINNFQSATAANMSAQRRTDKLSFGVGADAVLAGLNFTTSTTYDVNGGGPVTAIDLTAAGNQINYDGVFAAIANNLAAGGVKASTNSQIQVYNFLIQYQGVATNFLYINNGDTTVNSASDMLLQGVNVVDGYIGTAAAPVNDIIFA